MSLSQTAVVDSGTAASGGATEGLFTLAKASTYDALYANHIPQLYKRYGQQFNDTLAFLMAAGRIEPTDSETITLHEENRYHATVTIATGQTIAKTASTVTISSNTYVRAGDVLALDSEATILALVTAVNSATEIVASTFNTADTVTTSGTLVCPIISSLFKDGTGQPTPAISSFSKTTFRPQIVKETVKINGRELALGTWFGDTFWSTMMLQGEDRQSLKILGAMLLGQTPVSDGVMSTYVGTKGLIPTIKSRGAVQTYISGGYSLTDLDELGLYFLQQGVTSNVLCTLHGHTLGVEISNAVKDFLAGSSTGALGNDAFIQSLFPNINPADMNADGLKQMELDFNFKVVNIYNTTYVFKTENAFANPTFLGASSMELIKNGIVFPLASIADAKTGTKLSNLAIRPIAKGGYNRFMETWQTGAAGGNKSTYVDDTDALQANWRSDFMVQIAGANQMAYIMTT